MPTHTLRLILQHLIEIRYTLIKDAGRRILLILNDDEGIRSGIIGQRIKTHILNGKFGLNVFQIKKLLEVRFYKCLNIFFQFEGLLLNCG